MNIPNAENHCHDQPDDFIDCIHYFSTSMIVPRRPPSSPNLPPFSPSRENVLNMLESLFEHNRYMNFILVILLLTMISVLLAFALCCKCRRRRAFSRGNENDRRIRNNDNHNEIPMVTVVIHPDESSSLADDVNHDGCKSIDSDYKSNGAINE